MSKEPDSLKKVKEDILRIVGERKRNVSVEIITEEIKDSSAVVYQAIKELENEGLIKSQQGFLKLTGKNQEKANDILRKHLALEDYFKRTKTGREAHEMAHILEHYISQEVLNKIQSLYTLKKQSFPLTTLNPGEQGIISDFTFSDYGLFERIISMGIFPGEKIRMINEIPDGIIIKIENKKFVLDKDIAKEIKVLK
jgi:Mn-dependent DtxR family transcriptional regulator